MSTRLSPARYLEVIERDSARLTAVARTVDLAAPVPTCPGWTARDVVAHTAEVYQHKIVCIRLQARPQEWEQQAPAGVDVVEWFERSAATLLDELRSRGPDAPAYSWSAPDQTVGFWYRRMAQEVAIHRLDIEDAAGTPTPIDGDVALDGIDEVLQIFLCDDWSGADADDWGTTSPDAGAGTTTAVRAGGRTWRCTLQPDAITCAFDDGPADATVAGDVEPVLLWLWGRRPGDTVTIEGDRAALQAFRDRLHITTQ